MSHVDLEQGHNRHSVVGSEVSAEGESQYLSDAEDGSCYSHFYSINGGEFEDHNFDGVSDNEVEVQVDGVVADTGRVSSVTDCSVERDCRICHMGLESDSHECGVPIELGCCCKDDLAAAHKHCAETWFKIKGNRTCEICHCVAQNVFGPNEESTEHSSNYTITAAILSAHVPPPEPPRFWHGHRFLNFLLACIVFIFIISWLFRIKVPAS
ncbi:PREDICTED: uncharacterized protein LOC109352749 isoform X2 [Lupinus angustifolius]|uniref:uncharacterized protein LOC109352749 isoform X2 n=1 Tax=Lupinus angustifolius TaxID=3871 RepID=UPI00092F5DA9|nr:PREDICTED: uncharacterized protein LOC109352749 isoform X2 [Lupinus angustifolius]